MVAAASTCGTKKQLQGAWGDSRRLWGEARSRGLWRAHTTSWWEEAFLKWSRETGRDGGAEVQEEQWWDQRYNSDRMGMGWECGPADEDKVVAE